MDGKLRDVSLFTTGGAGANRGGINFSARKLMLGGGGARFKCAGSEGGQKRSWRGQRGARFECTRFANVLRRPRA